MMIVTHPRCPRCAGLLVFDPDMGDGGLCPDCTRFCCSPEDDGDQRDGVDLPGIVTGCWFDEDLPEDQEGQS
jgi:hypothetical protein